MLHTLCLRARVSPLTFSTSSPSFPVLPSDPTLLTAQSRKCLMMRGSRTLCREERAGGACAAGRRASTCSAGVIGSLDHSALHQQPRKRPCVMLCSQAAQNADGEGNGVAGDLTTLVKSLADVDAAPAKLIKVSAQAAPNRTWESCVSTHVSPTLPCPPMSQQPANSCTSLSGTGGVLV